MKLATYRVVGTDRVGLVHDHDSRLFDLAAAATRAAQAAF